MLTGGRELPSGSFRQVPRPTQDLGVETESVRVLAHDLRLVLFQAALMSLVLDICPRGPRCSGLVLMSGAGYNPRATFDSAGREGVERAVRSFLAGALSREGR